MLAQPPETGIDTSAFATSAMLSQVQVLPGDIDDQQWIKLDENGRAIDLRDVNTWTQKIDDVDPAEMVEVQCINSIAPFMLTRGLFAGLTGTAERPKFIVNLAAAEGAFAASHHQGTHPHTNMAKAALNMLTRTIANDFASRCIYVNSVDPGWVSDQRPRRAIAAAQLFPPLNYDDGAARVMHPILIGYTDSAQRFKGRLLRHYRPASW
jgi:NAD(P)-dependent dehydrogenase (short-subunit alcohol dehydrogenase family)